MTTPARAEQPLLRDLVDVPERIHQGAFVLRLTEGVRQTRTTLDTYEITPQLRVAFDQALGLIGSALETAAPAPATCTVRSVPARATSWRSCTRCCGATSMRVRGPSWPTR